MASPPWMSSARGVVVTEMVEKRAGASGLIDRHFRCIVKTHPSNAYQAVDLATFESIERSKSGWALRSTSICGAVLHSHNTALRCSSTNLWRGALISRDVQRMLSLI